MIARYSNVTIYLIVNIGSSSKKAPVRARNTPAERSIMDVVCITSLFSIIFLKIIVLRAQLKALSRTNKLPIVVISFDKFSVKINDTPVKPNNKA